MCRRPSDRKPSDPSAFSPSAGLTGEGRVKSLTDFQWDRCGSSLTINLYFFVFSPRHYDRPKKQAAHFWGSETDSGLGVFTKNGGTVFSAVLGSLRIVNPPRRGADTNSCVWCPPHTVPSLRAPAPEGKQLNGSCGREGAGVCASGVKIPSGVKIQ